MPVWSDMNGFPEGGFPVLANVNDMVTLGQPYLEPLRINNYMLDILGNNRLQGALVIAGTLTGVTSLTMNGALSGVSTISASGLATLSSDTPLLLSGANAILRMSGLNSSIGRALEKIGAAYFKKLFLDERPIVGENYVALVSDIVSAIAAHTAVHAPSNAEPNTFGLMETMSAQNDWTNFTSIRFFEIRPGDSPWNLTLPDAQSFPGETLILKAHGNCVTYNVTIEEQISETITFNTEAQIVFLVSNGSQWEVLIKRGFIT